MNGAVYSMTGFATGTSTPGAAQTITIDIRSVNSRFLDLTFKLPDSYRHIEAKLRELLAGHIKRGKCEIKLGYQPLNTDDGAAPISPHRIQSLLAQQSQVHSYASSALPLSVADIITLASTKNESNHEVASEADVLALMQSVISDFMQARALEGSKLVQVMLGQIKVLRDLQSAVVPLIPALVEQQRQRFLQKFSDALADSGGKISANVAEERALLEATAFAIRVDVTEEIDRLGSHLAAIESVLTRANDRKKDQELGKRLEFLIQELQREANTLGSKSASLQTTTLAVEMKVLIEQLREQVQNLE
jgi:uncharacterized protein (TIGR00255 family)